MERWQLGITLLTIVGCVEDAGGSSSGSVPVVVEQACLRGVTHTTNNLSVVLLNSTLSQFGTEVMVGVGARRSVTPIKLLRIQRR